MQTKLTIQNEELRRIVYEYLMRQLGDSARNLLPKHLKFSAKQVLDHPPEITIEADFWG